jgi:hypothetical protein
MEWHNIHLIHINTKILILQKYDFINIKKSKMVDKNNNDSHKLTQLSQTIQISVSQLSMENNIEHHFNEGKILCNIYIFI